MKIRKKLSSSIATAVLGTSLLVGGTFAYFSDQVVTNNVFAAGTLDLSLNPETVINIDNIKPGDSIMREFVLTNSGSLKIDTVNLETAYNVIDVNSDNGSEDFGDHIRVNFLWNWDKESEPIFQTTLSELQNMDPDVVQRDIWDPLWRQKGGLEPGATNDFWVEFEFVDNDEDQNIFQGDSLELVWTFQATQTDGEER
ncbi:CalY family protein [Oceanobacillus luteolus]|mgnify:CR=1 FL=1|uniref:TasA family protein n=1 Tax=Oceanobacillus luteolus TaxID=1274358 RepID=A0ABW4HX69_9BACI|nr:CalY family protein [Oceanobacillus luteolus]MCM3741195.1 CalY family protein [Oceanobacillus luteolus]